MLKEHVNDVLEQAENFAAYGYSIGFMQAVDLIKAVAKDAPEGAPKQNAEFFAKLMEEAMPDMLEKAKSNFQFKFIDEGNGYGRFEPVQWS